MINDIPTTVGPISKGKMSMPGRMWSISLATAEVVNMTEFPRLRNHISENASSKAHYKQGRQISS